MSQNPDPPPSSDNEQGSPNNPDAAICGTKFRNMLNCVEKSGAVAACTDKVNDFLACERGVFRSAIRKSAKAAPTSAPNSVQHHPPSPSPSKAPATTNANDPPEHQTQQGPFNFFAQPVKSVERLVRKQVSACSNLIETVRRPSYQTQLLQFNRRMLTDMRVTCEIIRAKTVSFVNKLVRAPREDDGKSGNA